MKINNFHYKLLTEPKKLYLNMPSVKIRENLNRAFRHPIVEEQTGIYGKFTKLDNLYKIKYIYGFSKQNQPLSFERIHYLLDVSEDENGSFVEYVMVYDKLYNPLIRLVYIQAVCLVLAYLNYAYSQNVMSGFSAITLGVIVFASIVLVFKRTNDNQADCLNAEAFIEEILNDFNN